MARVVGPGGSVVVIDFVSHDREWMRQELGVLRLGFTAEEIESGFALGGPRGAADRNPGSRLSRTADLPETFIASAERPSQ